MHNAADMMSGRGEREGGEGSGVKFVVSLGDNMGSHSPKTLSNESINRGGLVCVHMHSTARTVDGTSFYVTGKTHPGKPGIPACLALKADPPPSPPSHPHPYSLPFPLPLPLAPPLH